MDPLILAVDCEFSTETLDFLLEKGCLLSNSDSMGRTALHYAVDLENAKIVEYLV
jgi:ankyrin repeat protein